MKSLKKILVSLLLVAIAVSSFALVSGAEEDNLEAILEYHVNADYLAENYEAFATDSAYELNGNSYFTAVTKAASSANVIDDGAGNKLLEIISKSGIIKYDGDLGETKSLVISFRVYTDDTDLMPSTLTNKYYEYNPSTNKYVRTSPVNGCNLEIFLECVDSVAANSGENSMFIMRCHPHNVPLTAPEGVQVAPPSGALDPNGAGPETYAFYYKTYDPETKTFVDTKLEGLIPELQTWYTINAIFNFEKNEYEVQVTPDGKDTVSTGAVSLGSLVSAKGAEIRIDDQRSTIRRFGSKTLLDNFFIYQGSFLRDPSLKNEKTAEALVDISEAITAAGNNLEERIRLADILNTIAKTGYELPALADGVESDDFSAAREIYSYAKNEYINATYVEALKTYAARIADQVGYYARKDYISTVTRYVDMFPIESKDTWLTDFPGMKAEDVEAVVSAKEAYASELAMLDRIRIESNAFCTLLSTYDDTNKDYNYIKEQYNAIAHYVNIDPTYKYARELYGYSDKKAAELGIFVTLADAQPIFESLKEKKQTIDSTAEIFFDLVSNMQAEPVPMQDFAPLYDTYLKAAAVYNDGEFHPGLDNATFEGLVEKIELFLIREEYVLARVASCEDFIYYVNTAKTSTFYVTKLYNLDIAVRYIDDNLDEYTVEDDYQGIAEARELYAALREELAANVEAAAAYIAAVDVVKNVEGKTFAQRKADVAAALALKDAGAVEGIDGVKEANIALAEAEAYITAREGYSSTLIATVAAIKDAKTLAERRSLIYTASACVEGAEDSISGVTAAKAELESAIAAYNAEITAANNAFASVAKDAGDVCSAAAPQSFIYTVINVIKNFFN